MGLLLRFYREYLKPYRWSLIGGALLLQLGGVCQSLVIGALQFVFEDNMKMGSGHAGALPVFGPLVQLKALLMAMLPEASTLRDAKYFIPLLLVVIFFLKGVFTFSGTMVMVRSGIKGTQMLRERLFGRMLHQEPAFFQRHPVGELLQRSINDVAQVQGIASNQLAEAIKEITIALAMFIFLIQKDWRMTLTIFIAAPLVVLPVQYLSRRIRKYNHRNMEASSRLLQRLKEVFSNVRVVLGFAREDYEVARFHHLQHDLYRLGMKAARASALSHPVMEMVGGLLMAALIILVSDRIHSGALKGTDFLAYLLALYAFYDPIRRLTRLNAEFQVAQASLERIYGMMDRQPQLPIVAHPAPVPEAPSQLRFEDVHFSYDGIHPVLQGIHLEVKRGETIALVGGSGGGKTTLVNLVPRFFDPTQGRLLLDGVDLREFDPRQLRQRIGIVTQETLLFMDSIHDNIAYGKAASREAVVAAAKKAHAHDFIEALPKGYDTPLAETGSSVSGGQRQRLAIARALLQDPPILILDEATSALDTESERAVQAALETLMQDRTTLVIAHRLSTIQRATRICVLKHGVVVEQGRHDELLALGGEYSRLHRLQFAE
ncbi:MAG: ATP-binding cassette domain-containing protein [Firmicutes bacterium]|nr:ATP-binding cassette domain-containing protein [Bacillota bacterium]